jgi:hypothetical protein
MSLNGSIFFTPQLVFMRTTTLPLRLFNKITPIILAILFLSPIKLLSQSGNIDQIRNGPASNPSKNFYDDFLNPTWVNGNAGASNAHYVESHSIGYRSLITGAVIDQQYQYVIEYDTKHSDRMAIDYLTYYQRLQPHQQFGHDAEVINPLIMESGSAEYIMGTVNKDTFRFPVPSSVGSPVADLPTNSFLALPDSQRVLTMYNGDITNIQFVFQQSLTNGATASSSRIIITFKALKDSVLLTWGGHIANRNEWGFIEPGHIPRSAGGISGSPYHMRQISMNFLGGANISGVGNQDRSLSANAVIAPPNCSISPAQLACPETPSLTFSYTGGTTGATFVWSISNNTAGAQIQGGVNNGSSVIIVPSGADFIPGGTFDLTVAVTANGLTQSCSLTPAATIQNVVVVASANPTTINLDVSNTTQLNATVTPAPSNYGNYSFKWTTILGGAGSLNNDTLFNPVFTATESGIDTFIVTVTQKAAPNCVAKDTVVVEVISSNPDCGISGPDPVCPKSTNTYKYDINGDGTAESIPANYKAKWTLENPNGATLGANDSTNTVSVTAGAECKKSFTLILTLTNLSGLKTIVCDTTITVDVNSELTITCPKDTTLTCGASIDPATSTGLPTVPNNGCGVKVTYSDVITRTWVAVDSCGTTKTCTQTITVPGPCASSSAARLSTEPITTAPVVAPAITQLVKAPQLPANKPVISSKATSLNTDLQVQAFPNPFSNTVNFRFVSPVSGRAILEVFNTQGQRVGIAFDGKVDAGATKYVQFSTRLTNQALIYKLKVGDKTVRGTVLELKR